MAKKKIETASLRVMTGSLICVVFYFFLQALCTYFVFQGSVEEEMVGGLVYGCAVISSLLTTWILGIRTIKECVGFLSLSSGFILLINFICFRGCNMLSFATLLGLWALGVFLARYVKVCCMRKRKSGRQHRKRKST